MERHNATAEMAETDYRLISQEYAKGAIQAAILINGGAAIALLSQLKDLSAILPAQVLGGAFLLLASGVLLGALTWLIAFVSTRYVDRAQREQEPTMFKADVWMFIALTTCTLSLILFALACWILGWTYWIKSVI